MKHHASSVLTSYTNRVYLNLHRFTFPYVLKFAGRLNAITDFK